MQPDLRCRQMDLLEGSGREVLTNVFVLHKGIWNTGLDMSRHTKNTPFSPHVYRGGSFYLQDFNLAAPKVTHNSHLRTTSHDSRFTTHESRFTSDDRRIKSFCVCTANQQDLHQYCSGQSQLVQGLAWLHGHLQHLHNVDHPQYKQFLKIQ